LRKGGIFQAVEIRKIQGSRTKCLVIRSLHDDEEDSKLEMPKSMFLKSFFRKKFGGGKAAN